MQNLGTETIIIGPKWFPTLLSCLHASRHRVRMYDVVVVVFAMVFSYTFFLSLSLTLSKGRGLLAILRNNVNGVRRFYDGKPVSLKLLGMLDCLL